MPFGGALTVAAIGAAGSLASAAVTASAGKQSAATTREAAELQTKVQRELHEHWLAYYATCDASAIQALCAFPYYDFRPSLVAGRVRLEVLRSASASREQLRMQQDIYNTGAYCQTLRYLAATEAQALTDGYHYAWRYERAKQQEWNQLRISNRYRQLALGRNLLSQAMETSALAASFAMKAAQLRGEAAQGWAQLAGYLTSDGGQRLIGSAFRAFGIGGTDYSTFDNPWGYNPQPSAGQVPDMSESGSDWSRGSTDTAPNIGTGGEGQGFAGVGLEGQGFSGSDFSPLGGSAT
jgi:hypothetical protein